MVETYLAEEARSLPNTLWLPLGKVHTVYSFHGSDGSTPSRALTAIGTTLYGTASAGGNYGAGVVFSLIPDGQEHVLYNFTRKADGGYPVAGLLAVNGTLYSTTAAGGSPSCNGGGRVRRSVLHHTCRRLLGHC